MGLGKSLSMIALIASNQKKKSLVKSNDTLHKMLDVKATLLVVPLPC